MYRASKSNGQAFFHILHANIMLALQFFSFFLERKWHLSFCTARHHAELRWMQSLCNIEETKRKKKSAGICYFSMYKTVPIGMVAPPGTNIVKKVKKTMIDWAIISQQPKP
jgi:hypothetical protein